MMTNIALAMTYPQWRSLNYNFIVSVGKFNRQGNSINIPGR